MAKPTSRDGVQISMSAQQAAEVAGLLDMSRDQPEIRLDRVAAAKERLAQGNYQREDVVRQVAERIAQALPE